MKITIFNDVFGSVATEYDTPWERLCHAAIQPIYYATKPQMPLIKLARIGDQRTSRGSLRNDDNILAITGIEADYDAGIVGLDLARALLDAARIYALLYTTPSHSAEKPRWRVLAPLSREYAPTDRREFVGRLNAALGDILAPESFTLSQTYYWGAVDGVQYDVQHSTGHFIDQVQIAPVYPQSAPTTIRDNMQPAEVIDQLTLEDIVSALEFIPADERAVWVSVGQALVALGSVGYQIWTEWSRKSPKYDEADSVSKWATFTGQRTDYRAIFAQAARLGWTNPIRERARDLTGVEFDRLPRNEHFPFDMRLSENAPHWDVKVKKKLNTVENLEWLLGHYGISLYYDEMLKEQFVTYPNGSDILNDMSANGKLSRIRSLLALNEIPVETSSHISELLMRRTVNPIMQWITSKPWDNVDRLAQVYESVIVDPEHAEYRNLAMLTWFIQCVAAADGSKHSPRRDKIEKYESVLIFQGNQGLHKTSWVQSLVPLSYRIYIKDGVTLDVSNPDSKKAAISAWICELGELDATFRRSDISRLKSFLSSLIDELRLPYDRVHSKFQRRTSFFSTVNELDFLVDKTGNRRYLPIQVRQTRPLSDDTLDKQQLWAQVYSYYLQGAQWWPDARLAAMLDIYHRDHEQMDHVEELIRDKFNLENPYAIAGTRLTCSEIAKELGMTTNKHELNSIGRILRKNGFKSIKSSNGRRCYVIELINPFNDESTMNQR